MMYDDQGENQMPVKEKQQLIAKDLYTTFSAASEDVHPVET